MDVIISLAFAAALLALATASGISIGSWQYPHAKIPCLVVSTGAAGKSKVPKNPYSSTSIPKTAANLLLSRRGIKALHKIISLISDPASASYQEYDQLTVAILKSILKWVTSNENHFLYPNRMKSALQDLITELGGD